MILGRITFPTLLDKRHTQVQLAYVGHRTMAQRSLSSLKWASQFLEGTPGDEVTGGSPRQVPGACWSRVRPEPMPEPVLRLWSDEAARELGLEVAEPGLLGGNGLVEGMDPYAQRYGGYQFGNWAGQLGDGRAITLGEVAKMAGRCSARPFASFCAARRCTTSGCRQRERFPWSLRVRT